jgi:hypothetical protein
VEEDALGVSIRAVVVNWRNEEGIEKYPQRGERVGMEDPYGRDVKRGILWRIGKVDVSG